MAHAEQMHLLLSDDRVQTLRPSEGAHSVYLRFPVLMPSKQDKDALCRLSRELGLGISSMYPSAIRQVPELAESLSDAPVPHSVMIAERLVTLPTHELVSEKDVKRICSAIINLMADQVVSKDRVSVRSQCCGSEAPGPN
jgi:dTDP-4-amino-4,6-dideoxygalactose transaminase